jgi:peroxiredoxin
MKRTAFLVTILAAVALAQNAPAPMSSTLNVGDPAPDFTLSGTDGQVKLAELIGKKTVVLAFFPAAFTGG